MSKNKESYSTYYDLELERLSEQIIKEKHTLVLLQFPDGLKYYAKEVVDALREQTGAEFITYFGPCFGACDVPLHLKEMGFTLCVQWGHAPYLKRRGMW